MKVILLTICAHPEYGTAQPGQVKDLPEAFAAQLIAARYAVAVEPLEGHRSEGLQSSALETPEKAMLPSAGPRKRDSRKG